MKPLFAALLAAAPHLLLAQPARLGLPACRGPHAELADKEFFLLCHDSSFRVPTWTAYELVPGRIGGSAPRPRRFRVDTALSGPAARDSDYRNTGFTRGHLVPAEDLAFSSEAIRSTFVLSNAAPQLHSVNAGNWRRLENAVRNAASESDATYVFTGPVFADHPARFAGAVAVPTHFFKVWLRIQGSAKRMYAAIVPNARACAEALDTFAVSVDEVERTTGLDFFSALEDDEEQRLESTVEPIESPRRARPCEAATEP